MTMVTKCEDAGSNDTELPELDLESFSCVTNSSSAVTAACLLQLQQQQQQPQSPPQASVGIRHLLLRAKAALIRLGESSGTADTPPAVGHQLTETLASIDACLSTDGGGIGGGGIVDCCQRVRDALRLLDCDSCADFTLGSDETQDEETQDEEVDEEETEDEEVDEEETENEEDLMTVSRLKSWTPEVASSNCWTSHSQGTSASSSLLPSDLLHQFDRCNRQCAAAAQLRAMQQSRRQQLGALEPGTKSQGAANAGSNVEPQAKHPMAAPARQPMQRRQLIVRPAASMFGHLLRGRHFVGRREPPAAAAAVRQQHQQQQQQQVVLLGQIRCHQPDRHHQRRTLPVRRRSPAAAAPVATVARVLLRTGGPEAGAPEPPPPRRQRPSRPAPPPGPFRVMAHIRHSSSGGCDSQQQWAVAWESART